MKQLPLTQDELSDFLYFIQKQNQNLIVLGYFLCYGLTNCSLEITDQEEKP